MAAGLAVAEGVGAACGLRCLLKWPNDVLLDQRKGAGVLVEVRRRKGVRCVVVGIGVNVNAAPPADEPLQIGAGNGSEPAAEEEDDPVGTSGAWDQPAAVEPTNGGPTRAETIARVDALWNRCVALV